jgi:hypothetical protein
MDSSALYDAFRSDVVDTAQPQLWSDDEVWRYMNDAYFQLIRFTGGVADFLSEACEVPVVTGEALVDLHPAILRIMSVSKRSDTRPVDVINSTDVAGMRTTDYGLVKQLILDDKPGEVRYLVHGMQRGKARLVQVPTYDDYLDLHIYRLPLNTITGDGQSFSDLSDEHHLHLLDWMKHLAYKKNDAETFNPQASEAGRQNFVTYAMQMKAEFERYKHKPRSVAYGGL